VFETLLPPISQRDLGDLILFLLSPTSVHTRLGRGGGFSAT
jgi:hypothetical protein